jgi:flagellin
MTYSLSGGKTLFSRRAMSRIGGFSGLTSGQLSALNRIHQLTRAIAQNTKRLSTFKRINSAKDDPSGLIQATRLERELNAAQVASESITRAGAILSTADSAAAGIISQLQSARTLVLEVADGTKTSAADIAANQILIDTIIAGIDSLAKTEFAGKRLLDGSSGYYTTGVDNSTIKDVVVLNKSTSGNVTIDITIDTQATQATNSYTGGQLSADATLVIGGLDGTTTISLNDNDTTTNIVAAINAVTYATGITATRVDDNQIDFATVAYGTNASISIEATQGSFDLTTTGTVTGTDAVATINGQSVTGDGSSFNFHSNSVGLVINVDPTANGTLNSFTVSGEGLNVVIGTTATSTARFGLPNLNTATIGGLAGSVSSIGSGRVNSLTDGSAATALQIIDNAITDVLIGQSLIGGFQKFTLDSASSMLTSVIENTSSALSAVQDADIALETALLSRNQLLQQTSFEALSISNLKDASVLALLRAVALRY